MGIITNNDFVEYSTYFALAASAGLRSAQRFHYAIQSAEVVDTSTFEIYQDALNARNSLLINLRSSYERIFSNAFELRPMEDSFVGLAEHILKFAGQSVDDYLTTRALKVMPTYANISGLLGEAISDDNLV